MNLYIMRTTAPISLSLLLMAAMLLNVSCRKEKAPAPSNADKDYFVITDNPNDPVDHAIYEFYRNTGIASFYNDTIYKRRTNGENENPPSYSYIRLSLDYAPLSNLQVYSKPVSSREQIPALLTLMQEEMVPKLPANRLFPSILFIDSFSFYPIIDIQVPHGWSSLPGFNTLGIVVKDVEAMNEEERKVYVGSIMAGIAEKRINELMANRVQKEFLSITREVTQNLIPIDIYFGVPFIYVLTPDRVPPPADIGFLFYPTLNFRGVPAQNMPRETDDIRGFLTAVFSYTDQEFAALHPNETLVLKKFGIMKNFAKEAGFKFPE